MKVILGGAPVTEEWVKEIGSDGFGEKAVEAVNVAKCSASRIERL